MEERKELMRKMMRYVKMPPEMLEYSGDVADVSTTIAALVAGCQLDKKTMSGPEVAIIAHYQGWSKLEKDLLVESLKMNDVWRGAV